MKLLDGRVSPLIQTGYHWDDENRQVVGEEVNLEKEPVILIVKSLQN